MRVLLVGSGGREHAMAWMFRRSPSVTRLLWAPGNGAAASDEILAVKADDVARLVHAAEKERVDLVAVGPEGPLADGIWDALNAKGIPCFGPSQAAARLESSKAFCKHFCRDHAIPTSDFTVWNSLPEAKAYLESYTGPYPLVLKADGLAAGKGVLICADRAEALEGAETILGRKAFGAAGDRMVVEAFVAGEEASLMVFCDGETVVPMPPARDHKRVGDGDKGPNTGGMGAFCPSPRMSASQIEEALGKVIRPAVAALSSAGTPYRGVLYAGLMLTVDGPQVLEFNCRLGDPETQVVLPLLDGDLGEIAMGCATGALSECSISWKPAAAVTVVLCSEGYPGTYATGKPIDGLEAASDIPGVVVFQAGTRREGGRLLTAGGRVLDVTAVAATLGEARARAYEAAGRIRFEGKVSRSDIAADW